MTERECYKNVYGDLVNYVPHYNLKKTIDKVKRFAKSITELKDSLKGLADNE